MTKRLQLLIGLMIFIVPAVFPQQSGRIVYRDSTFIRIAEFKKLRSELFYYNPKDQEQNSGSTVMDFMRDYSPEKIKSIKFRYEKGVGTDKFYYEFLVEGITPKGTLFSKKIKTWDWLEMTLPESGPIHNTEITFFTEDRRLEIERIELKQ